MDSDNKTLKFAAGDKLYITGTNIQGVLEIQDGIGSASGATFSGDLDYSGSGSPADGLSLTATLVSAQQTVGTQVSVDGNGAITVNYPTAAYCATISDAVQQYSWLTGTSTYGDKAFTLTQQTAFLNFEITVKGGTHSGTTLPARFINNGASIAKANVTTVTDGAVKAKFVLPVAKGTALSSATVKLGGMEITSAISNTTLSTGKVYNVKRTVDMSSVTLANTLNTADMTVKVNYNYSDDYIYCLFVSNGNGTYTFQSGGGYVPNHWGNALVVEDGKLVFKQNAYPDIATSWNDYGYSVTFDTSNNTYRQWAGGEAESRYNPSFISVEVNGKEISLTSADPVVTPVTWNISGMSDIELKDGYENDGVTLQGDGTIDCNQGALMLRGDCTFTNTLGKNFKKIVISAEMANIQGWSFNPINKTATWEGTSSSVTIGRDSQTNGITSIVFYLVDE